MSKAHIPPAVAITGNTTLIEKKEKWTNKGTDKQYVAKKNYTQYNLPSDLMFVPNFNILGKVVPEKIFDENFHIHYIEVRDRKKET